MTKCPKCDYQRKPNDTECPRCGIVYKKYEDYIAKKQQKTDKETNKEEEILNTEKAELGAQHQNSQIEKTEGILNKDKKRRKFYVALIVIVVLIGGYILIRQMPELKARKVVDAHLKSIMSGEGNPYSTVDILKVQEIFINVIDYKYLTTLKKDRVLDKPFVLDKKRYDEFYYKVYKTYDEYLNKMQELYGDRATRTEDGIVVQSDGYHYEFEFLYDITLTNKLGMKLYKKYVFQVSKSDLPDYGYAIVGFHERE